MVNQIMMKPEKGNHSTGESWYHGETHGNERQCSEAMQACKDFCHQAAASIHEVLQGPLQQ